MLRSLSSSPSPALVAAPHSSGTCLSFSHLDSQAQADCLHSCPEEVRERGVETRMRQGLHQDTRWGKPVARCRSHAAVHLSTTSASQEERRQSSSLSSLLQRILQPIRCVAVAESLVLSSALVASHRSLATRSLSPLTPSSSPHLTVCFAEKNLVQMSPRSPPPPPVLHDHHHRSSISRSRTSCAPRASLTFSVLLLLLLLAGGAINLMPAVRACSCDLRSLRAVFCRSKYVAIVQVIGEKRNVARPMSVLTSSPHVAASSPFLALQAKPLMRMDGGSSSGREREGEARERNDVSLRAHRMAVQSVIAASQEGGQALASQLLWTKSPRRSSCRADLQPGQRYLVFGDVSPDARAFVTLCNLIPWSSLTSAEMEEIRWFQEHGLRCR